MPLLFAVITVGLGVYAFFFFVTCVRDYGLLVLGRLINLRRLRTVKLAELSRIRRKRTAITTGAEGPDPKSAARVLEAMMAQGEPQA